MKSKNRLFCILVFFVSMTLVGSGLSRTLAAQDNRWTLSPEPVVQIGVDIGDPSYEFHRIAGAVRLTDRRIVVADGGSCELRYYDPAGRFLKSVGGEGGGPEEFQRIWRIYLLAGDTIATFDSSRRRVATFDQDGQYTGAIPVVPAAGIPRPNVQFFFEDGGMLGYGYEPSPHRPGLWTREYHLIRYTADGMDTKYLGAFPGWEMVIVAAGGPGTTRQPALFGNRAYFAAGSDHFYHLWTGDNVINKYSQDGELVGVLQADRAPRRITTRDVSSARRELLGKAHIPELREVYEAVIEQSPTPEFLPVFGWPIGEPKYRPLYVDEVGNLWLLNFELEPEESLTWTVLTEDGEHIFDVAVPREFRPFQIGDDFVIGLVTDESDIEYVRMYELVKR